MASLLRPYAKLWTPGQEKPQGVPQIDWSHPLAAGLIFYGFDTGMGLIVDLARGRPMIANKSSGGVMPALGVNKFGTGFAWDGAHNAAFASDAEIRNANAAPPWAAACGFVGTAAGIQQNSTPFYRTFNNNGSPFQNWGFQSPGNGSLSLGAFVNNGGSQAGVGSAFTWTANAYSSIALVANSGSSCSYFGNGVQSGTTTTGLTVASGGSPNDAILFGDDSGVVHHPLNNTMVLWGGFWGRALSQSELLQLYLDPYCFLLPPEGEMPALFVSSGTITEVLAATETKDVAAFAGALISSGALAATETKDVAAFVGKEIASGTLAATETKDVAAFVGKEIASGVLGATEAKDVSAFAGLMGAFGALGATETKDAAAFAGKEIASGALATTEAKDAAAFAGFLTATGTLAATEAKDLVRFGSPSRKLRGGPFFGTLGRMKEM